MTKHKLYTRRTKHLSIQKTITQTYAAYKTQMYFSPILFQIKCYKQKCNRKSNNNSTAKQLIYQ